MKKAKYHSLETERLILKIITLQDAEAVLNHFSDEEVTKFMDIEPCRDIKEAEEMINFHLDDLGCRWGLFDKIDNRLIGTCGYHCLRETSANFIAEVGFDLSKPYWGQGFMHEAMIAVIEFGFKEMGLTMIDATVEPANERSIHLLEKLRFKRAAELRDNLLYYSFEDGRALF